MKLFWDNGNFLTEEKSTKIKHNYTLVYFVTVLWLHCVVCLFCFIGSFICRPGNFMKN